MKRIAIYGLLLLLLVVPAMAYTENFQNWDGTGWGIKPIEASGEGSSSLALVTYDYSDTYVLRAYLTGQGWPPYAKNSLGVYYTTGTATNDFAFTFVDGASASSYGDNDVLYMWVLDSGGSVLVGAQVESSFVKDIPKYTRYHISRENQDVKVYRNGTYISSLGSTATQPYFFVVGARDSSNYEILATYIYIDDVTVGSGLTDVVGLPPHTWFVGKDLLDPSVKGLFDASYNNIYTNYFHYTIANTTGASIQNYSMPDPPTSGTITITSGSASDYIQARSVVLSGTNISWSSSTYAANDLAGINWTITSQYWDTTLYDYKFKVYEYANGTTTLKQTTAINTANGTGTYQTTTDGIYTAALILDYKTAPNTDYWLDSDFMEVLQGIKITGTVYDAFNGTAINASTVYCEQASTNESTSSNVTGGYTCPFTLSTGLSTKFTCNKVNYTPDVFTYTFTKPGTYYVDLNLLPYNGTSAPTINGSPIWNGTAIYGLILATPYNTAVEGATVLLSDGNSTTSSATGYYHFDNVLDNTTYTVSASKTGFSNGSTSVTTGVSNTGTRADVYLSEGFTLTVNIKDSVTGSITTNQSTVCINGASCTGTTAGASSFSLAYGTYTVSASAAGYYENQENVDVAGNMAITMYLTPTNTKQSYEVSNLGPGQAYPPHHVRFTIQTVWGKTIPNATVTALGYETTAGSFQWLYDIMGFNSTATPIANTTLTGTTDHLGDINFMMFEAVKYNVTINATGYANKTFDFYPKDEYYIIAMEDMANGTWYQGGYNIQEMIISNVTGNELTGNITVNYTDFLNSTGGGTLWLNQTNKTNVTFAETSISNVSIATFSNKSNWNYTFVPTAYAGKSFIVRIRANSSVFTQNITRDYGVTFRPAQINPMGLSDFELMLISMFFLIFMATMFGAINAPQGGILVCFVGWILWMIGWMRALGDTAPIVLTLATVMAVAVLVYVRSRKVNYL